MSVVIPDKTYFKIGEVSKLIGVKPYILRYWESEFKVLRPQKSRSRHRLYRRRDVEILLQIRQLLYEQKFTIAGAKTRIQDLLNSGQFVPGKSGLAITESEIENDPRSSASDLAFTPIGDGPLGTESPDLSGTEASSTELELLELAAQLQGARSLIAELQEALTTAASGTIERELELLREELLESRSVIASLKEAQTLPFDTLKIERDALAQALAERDAELATARAAHAELVKQSDETRVSAAEARTAQQGLEANVLEMTQRLLENKEALDAAEAVDHHVACRETLADVKSALTKAENERDENAATNAALREELLDVKDELATALALEDELEASREHSEALSAQISELSAQIQAGGPTAASEDAIKELEAKLQYQVNFHTRVSQDLRKQLTELVEIMSEF